MTERERERRGCDRALREWSNSSRSSYLCCSAILLQCVRERERKAVGERERERKAVGEREGGGEEGEEREERIR